MGRCRRRQLVRGLAAAAGLGILAGCGVLAPRAPQPEQPEKIRRIGFLAAPPAPSPPGALLGNARTLLDGLRELGRVDGQNLVVDYRYAEFSDERFPRLAAELVALAPDVIVATTTTAALAARDVTQTVPVVMPNMLDPVGSGPVESLARPGGNVTGLSFYGPVLSGKRLELLKDTVPSVSEVAIFWAAGNVGSASDFRQTQADAASFNLQVRSVGIHSRDDFDGAFAALTSRRPDALLVLPENVTFFYRQLIIDFAASSRLPAMYPQASYVVDGGLMAYGPDSNDVWRRAATYVDKLFRGARAADLPVEQPTKFDFVVNLKTAQALGITIPKAILQQTTEIIQ
jgi:putative ABC transport system substrate-binding protein